MHDIYADNMYSHVRLFGTPQSSSPWNSFPFSRGSSQPRDWTQVSRIAGQFFITWVTREAHFTAYYYKIPVHSKGDQSWVFFGRNDAKAKTPVLWPPHAKSWLIGKVSDAGRDWGQEEKGTTEDDMAGWHHRLDGCEFEWTPGVGDGQGGLACCSSWGCKKSDMTERLNWTELIKYTNLLLSKVKIYQTFTHLQSVLCAICSLKNVSKR